MPKIQFTEEFRQEAIRQIVDRGRPVVEVSAALSMSTHSLYAWLKEFKKPVEASAAEEEVKRLQAELRNVTEERDILKKLPRALLASQGEVQGRTQSRC
jgi:transposase